MPRLKQTVFMGMQPKVSTELLPDHMAQQATNMKLTSGALEPWGASAVVAGVTLSGSAELKTIYRYGQNTPSKTQYWWQFTGDVDIVKGPVAGDTEERTYWTDGGYPKKSKSDLALASAPYPSGSLRMGVLPPGWTANDAALSFTPTATVSGTATDPDSTAINSVYVITYLTTWGEESAPSNPSIMVTWRPGQTVTVDLPSTPSGAYSISKCRIYRSATGSNRTTFLFVAERNLSTGTYADTKLQSQLGEAITTWDFWPPETGMTGLTDMGNGMLAGFYGSTVSFCEPGFPYAWPAKYDTAMTAPIVGICAFGQSLFVGLTNGAVVLTGNDPAAISQETIKDAQACLSKRSIVGMMGGVVYAGQDGLCYVGPGGVRNISEKILTRQQWQAYAPTSFTAAAHDGRYIAFWDNGTDRGSLIFTFGDESSFVESVEWGSAVYVDRLNDALFMIQGNTILNEWDAGGPLTATWRSKDYRFPGGTAMARAMVEAASYPVTFKYYVDGTLEHTQTVTSRTPFPLPALRGTVISYEVASSVKVHAVAVATSSTELGNG